MSEAAPQKVTTFDRLRAIVGGGHLADMMGAEAKVLIALVVHADYATGEAYPSMETIARCAGITNVNRARKSVRKLVERGVLSETAKSSGRATVVRRIECPRPTGTVSVRDAKRTGTQNVRDGFDPSTGTLLSPNRDGFDPSTGTVSVPRTHQNTLGNTSENTSLPAGAGESDSGDEKPTAPKTRKKTKPDDPDVERIWLAYPRKVAKPAGVKAIAKALVAIRNRPDAPPDAVAWLEERVRAYAAACEGKDAKYVKFPQGWFNDCRFDDETHNGNPDNPCPTQQQIDEMFGPLRRKRAAETNSKGEFLETIDASDLLISDDD